MKCSSCGAPLTGKSNVCRYCGSLNDTDLRGLHYYTAHEANSERICPRCKEHLQSLDLKLDGHFYIDRCRTCLGIFFDSGELDYLLEHHVQNIYEVDHDRLNTLVQKQRKENNWPTTYIQCPVCQKFMNRQSYKSRSGVIVDTCKEHGIWVDGGELGILFRWVKAGGQIHSQNRTEDRAAEAKRNVVQDLDIWTDDRFDKDSDENNFVKVIFSLFM